MELTSEEILGSSAHVCQVRRFIGEAAATSRPIVLVGEPGAGKEIVARLVHRESSRHKQPFLMIDCSLYFEREFKREVFGYRGLGRAAKSRKGLFEFASRGTCYLSRIEELSAGLQECLLGFLRTGRYRRLGDGREISSRTRLIVSSDKNLPGFVEGGLFDEELYQALCGLSLRLRSLRERPEDIDAVIVDLTASYCREHCLDDPPRFTREALEALKCFPWPRNFDELRYEVVRALESAVNVITPEKLSFEIASHWTGQQGNPELREVLRELDGYIQEFRVLSQLDAEFGDILLNIGDSELEISSLVRELMGED